MIWAIKNNKRIEAKPKDKARCPLCNEEVISKCGNIKIWHWAHKSKKDCDFWTEPESEWHYNWKQKFPKKMQEYKFDGHIADIYNGKIVIELQNSPISQKEIIERENFYENMVWILNGKTIAKNISFSFYKNNLRYKWKWFPKSWEASTKKIYIDFGNDILLFINFASSNGILTKLSKIGFIIENGGRI